MLRNKKGSRGAREHTSLKNFAKIYIYTVISILMLFEQFLKQILFKFFILSTSPYMMHFVCTHLLMFAGGVGIMVIEEVQNYLFNKNILLFI